MPLQVSGLGVNYQKDRIFRCNVFFSQKVKAVYLFIKECPPENEKKHFEANRKCQIYTRSEITFLFPGEKTQHARGQTSG